MSVKIFIDQGHNPMNPNAGAEAGGVREQDVNYEVGIRLGRLLEDDPRFEVKLSRPDRNTQLGNSKGESLRMRVQAANSWGADYFISIHCNANTNPAVSGSEAYVFAAGTAASALACDLLDELHDVTGLRNRGVMARPGLYVLRATVMPAVLVELGYLTNDRDRSLLTEDPQSFARGLYQGILEYVDVD